MPFLLMIATHYMAFYWDKNNIRYRKAHGAHIADKDIATVRAHFNPELWS